MLIACRAGKSGAAQAVADQLRRPVIAFNKRVYVEGPKFTAMGRITGTTYTESNGVFELLHVPRIGPFPDYRYLRPGVARTFMPRLP
ncbi:hypothetical protein D3C78_1637000 [compost metagenome]